MSEPGRNEQEAIARRAYEIWEAEGRPDGRDREHWEAASRELGSPMPMPADYKDGAGLPGLDAAVKKPARRPKIAAAVDDGASKPGRRKRPPTT
jgi:Protein of unknown function (DUF2934)